MEEAAAAMTLSDQLAVPDSPDLRDLLKAHNSIRRRRRRRAADKRNSSSAAAEASSLRTLHDILRDDEESGGSRERLRRRRRPDSAESVIPAPIQSPIPVPDAVVPLPPNPMMEPFVTLEVILAEQISMEEQPVRVSLMALLEQAEGGIPAAAEEEMEDEEGRVSGCCVCMTRGKGAAFIPCGHTFCRPCARELMARRGSCPLCNADIHQILNIY